MGKQSMTVPMVIAGLVGLILLVAGEWVLIMVVAALVFAYYTWSMVPSEIIEYQLTSRGVRIGDSLYDWIVFSRWWRGEKWGQQLLFIEMPGSLTGSVALSLGQENPERIEKVMEKMLLFEKPKDTVLGKAGKWLEEKFPLQKI
jgi:hypothetical protein